MSEIKSWIECNMLKLNDYKAVFIVFKSRQDTNSFTGVNVQVGGILVELGSKVRNFGVIFNQTLSVQNHVNAIAKVCFYNLRNIARICCKQGHACCSKN